MDAQTADQKILYAIIPAGANSGAETAGGTAGVIGDLRRSAAEFQGPEHSSAPAFFGPFDN
jgi:hypothetical protein